MAAGRTIEELNKTFGLSSVRDRRVPYDLGYGVVLAEQSLSDHAPIDKIRAGDPCVSEATAAFLEAGIISQTADGIYHLNQLTR